MPSKLNVHKEIVLQLGVISKLSATPPSDERKELLEIAHNRLSDLIDLANENPNVKLFRSPDGQPLVMDKLNPTQYYNECGLHNDATMQTLYAPEIE